MSRTSAVGTPRRPRRPLAAAGLVAAAAAVFLPGAAAAEGPGCQGGGGGGGAGAPSSCAAPRGSEDDGALAALLQLQRHRGPGSGVTATTAAPGAAGGEVGLDVGDNWLQSNPEAPPVTWWPKWVQTSAFKEPKKVDAGNGNVTLVITTCEFTDPVSRRAWWTRCYNGTIPGPTIHMQPGSLVNITVVNSLKDPSPKPITLQNATEAKHEYEMVRLDLEREGFLYTIGELVAFNKGGTGSLFGYINDTNLHTHGLVVGANQPADDVLFSILPDDPRHERKHSFSYQFPIPAWHSSGTYWYHPHRHHSATHQTHGGAFGAIIMDDVPGDLPALYSRIPERLLDINVMNVSSHEAIGILSRDELGKAAVGVRSELALVNGKVKAEMRIEEGKWYRFRMVFASNIRALRMMPFSWSGAQCQLRLIAKDGIYLADAPRTVSKILLASGNRADVLVGCRCTEGRSCSATFSSVLHLPEWMIALRQQNAGGPGPDAAWKRTFVGPVFNVRIVRPPFKTKMCMRLPCLPPLRLSYGTPCYLADLTNVSQEKVDNHTVGFIYEASKVKNETGNGIWGRYLHGGNDSMFLFLIGGYFNMTWDNKTGNRSIRFLHETQPAAGAIQMGTVQQWEIVPPGTLYHPIHPHVQPFQITNLEVRPSLEAQWEQYAKLAKPWIEQTVKEISEWYKVGDWQDTLMTAGAFPNVTTLTARLRFIPQVGPTKIVVHCHWLQHEDQGMMMYLNSTGDEAEAVRFAERLTGCSNAVKRR